MTLGLTDSDGNPLFDPKQPPWTSSHVKVKAQKSKNDILNKEDTWCYNAYSWNNHIAVKPQTQKWKWDKALEGLIAHPIGQQGDGINDAALDLELVTGEIARCKARRAECCYAE